jgi:hypothetical protein
LVSISTLASAEDVAFLQSYTTNQISIVVGFVPDASRVIVGEPLFFTFVVSNRADQPFKFSFFGDSNFRINATNANGMPTRNRHSGWGGDGGGSSISVLHGKAYNERVLLYNWCGFDLPGEYTVTCRYLFPNYPNGNTFLAPLIVTVFKLTVLPTNPNRITEIIKVWGLVVETNGSLREAAQALTEINDPRTIPYLAVLIMKDSDINYIAADALARFTNNLVAARCSNQRSEKWRRVQYLCAPNCQHRSPQLSSNRPSRAHAASRTRKSRCECPNTDCASRQLDWFRTRFRSTLFSATG